MEHPANDCIYIVIKFAGVDAQFVLCVCENLLSRTRPDDSDKILLGGVHMKLYVNTHWSGFDRYMLIGQGWTCGFNLQEPTSEENVFEIFSSRQEMFTPHLTGELAFIRDMTVLTMTASDWRDADGDDALEA